ncbi:MAG TPA: hypothetical protein VFA18_04105 [Gemmataceae bacterium]|nr:hypothetical protein [Gemmataceae bacterium]
MCDVSEAEERERPAAKSTSRPRPAAARKSSRQKKANTVPPPTAPSPSDPTAPITGDFLEYTADITGGSDDLVTLTCTACGYRLRVPVRLQSHYRQCHRCGSRVAGANAGSQPAPSRLLEDDDDGQPYDVAGGPERRCPECSRVLTPEAGTCAGCGLDLVTGEKPPPKTYPRIERRWQSGWPVRRRVVVWIAGQIVYIVVSGVIGWMMGQSLFSILTTWVVFTAMLSFVLGTYDWIDFTCNERGKVRLTQTWRVLFLRRPPTRLKLAGCDGVQTGQGYHVGALDWLIFLSLVCCGVIPGIIWFFGYMHRETYHVALTRDHGYAEHLLYRGWSRDQAWEMAHTIADATGLPYEGF